MSKRIELQFLDGNSKFGTYLEKAVVQDSDVAQSSFERHFSAKAQTPPRHSWNSGHWLFLLHLGTHFSLTQTWLSKQSLMEEQGGEQTPKAQIRLAGQLAWLEHVRIGEHPTVGLPVKPGWHEHKGVWLNTVHKALAPQTPAKLQIKETKIQIQLNLSFWDGLMSDRLIKKTYILISTRCLCS